MKTVAMDICNGLMATSIKELAQRAADLAVCLIRSCDVVSECMAISADIALLEVSFQTGASVEDRKEQARALHQRLPGCKIILLCDENSTPEQARKVAVAKKDGWIDDFLFTSVGENYLSAVLQSI